MFLEKAHAVQHFFRFAIEAVRELLGVRKCAADSFDHTLLAANIERRAAVPGRKSAFYRDAITHIEAMAGRRTIRRRIARSSHSRAGRCHRLAPFLTGDSISSGTLKRARTSAILIFSSPSVIRFFSINTVRSAEVVRSKYS